MMMTMIMMMEMAMARIDAPVAFDAVRSPR
jgi:hypothetical protein